MKNLLKTTALQAFLARRLVVALALLATTISLPVQAGTFYGYCHTLGDSAVKGSQQVHSTGIFELTSRMFESSKEIASLASIHLWALLGKKYTGAPYDSRCQFKDDRSDVRDHPFGGAFIKKGTHLDTFEDDFKDSLSSMEEAETVYLFCISSARYDPVPYEGTAVTFRNISTVIPVDTDILDYTELGSDLWDYTFKNVEHGWISPHKGRSCSLGMVERAVATDYRRDYIKYLKNVFKHNRDAKLSELNASDWSDQIATDSESTQPGSLELSITDGCRDGRDIQYRIFGYSTSSPSGDYIGMAPESGLVYIAKDSGGKVTNTYACKTEDGETVRSWCYGANRPSGHYWGVGIDGDKGCEECCASCPTTGTSKRSMNLICDG